MKDDLGSRYSVRNGFQMEWFVTLGLLGCYGGSKGISVGSVVRYLNRDTHGVTHRAVEKRLLRLLQYGYVVRVKRGRFYYYSLSSHAEKLLRDSVGVRELKLLNSQIRLLLKS